MPQVGLFMCILLMKYDEDTLVVNSVVIPYENEPLASANEAIFVSVGEDADGIDPEILEARFKGAGTLNEW